MEKPIESYYTPEVRNARERESRRKKKRKIVLCPHGYTRRSACLKCTPSNACACGSKVHRIYCCERGHWNAFGRNSFGGKEAQKSAPAAPAPAPEPAKKMRKVTVGAVEMMVEDGATLTIAGVPITFQ